jgi:hypothetical protein
LVRNHFTWVFEPFRQQRILGKAQGDEALIQHTVRQVCDRLQALLEGKAGFAPITAVPQILHVSPYGFVIADEKGDPNSRLVLAAGGYTNLISLVCVRKNGRYTYSIIRGSPYDEDTFQVTRLMQAFQEAEDLPRTKIWGGSNLAAGSDSELGSSLHWTRLRDIAEPIAQAAVLANCCSAPTQDGCREHLAVLVVMSSDRTPELKLILEQCGAEVFTASSCAEARRVLGPGRAIPIRAVFSAQWLPDGGFWDLVAAARLCAGFVPIIVCLPDADGGCTDLLEAGVSDLIVEPYQAQDIARILDKLGTYGHTEHPGRTSGFAT